jgi:transposase
MELRDEIRERRGAGFGYGTVWLTRYGIMRKNKSGRAADREDAASPREEWFESLDLNLEKLEEASVAMSMARYYGRTPRGECSRAYLPFGHWVKTSLIATAPQSHRRADGDRRRARWALVPGLFRAGSGADSRRERDCRHGQHAPAHDRGLAEAIEAKRKRFLYFPPDSSDFNPIERSFAKIKSDLQRIAAPTTDALDAAVVKALRSFTTRECTEKPRCIWLQCRLIGFRSNVLLTPGARTCICAFF